MEKLIVNNSFKNFRNYRDYTYWPIVARIWFNTLLKKWSHFGRVSVGVSVRVRSGVRACVAVRVSVRVSVSISVRVRVTVNGCSMFDVTFVLKVLRPKTAIQNPRKTTPCTSTRKGNRFSFFFLCLRLCLRRCVARLNRDKAIISTSQQKSTDK